MAVYDEALPLDELQKLDWEMGTIKKQTFERRSVHMWVLDFNRCQAISMDEKGLIQAVRAFYKNDPYYPRPGSDDPNNQAVWERFSTHYLAASKRILGNGDNQTSEYVRGDAHSRRRTESKGKGRGGKTRRGERTATLSMVV